MSQLWQGKEYVLPKDLAPLLGVSARTVRRRCEAGTYKSQVVHTERGAAGKEYRVSVEDAIDIVKLEGVVNIDDHEKYESVHDFDHAHGQGFHGHFRGQDGDNVDTRTLVPLMQAHKAIAVHEATIAKLEGANEALENERNYLRQRVQELEGNLNNKMAEQEKRLEERDKTLMEMVSMMRDAMVAKKEEEASKKSFWQRLFGK